MNLFTRFGAGMIPAAVLLAGAGFAAQSYAGDDVYTADDISVAITGDIEVYPMYPDPDYPGADDSSLVTFPAEVCVNAIPESEAEQGYNETRISVDDFTTWDRYGNQVGPQVPDSDDPNQFPEKDTYGVGECASGTIEFVVELSETDTNWISWKHRASNQDAAWEVPAQP